ncbi:MAG: hypothetical protein RL407_1060 [Bacteroidota bacterium]
MVHRGPREVNYPIELKKVTLPSDFFILLINL